MPALPGSWAIALMLFCLSIASTFAAIQPVGLKCGYAVNPLDVDVAQPRLLWRVESNNRNARQSAYQILAASSSAMLNKDKGDLWDSGKVMSDETLHIAYAGKRLASSQQVFWKVRAGNESGRDSGWSGTATFTMGVLRGLSCAAPPLRVIETIQPVGLKSLSKSATNAVEVFDLGQNAPIIPRITVKGPSGVKFLRAEGDRALFEVGAGRYEFASEW